MTGNLAQALSPWESGLEVHIFPKSFVPTRAVFPPLLKKESSNFSPQTPGLPFQYGPLHDPTSHKYDIYSDSAPKDVVSRFKNGTYI